MADLATFAIRLVFVQTHLPLSDTIQGLPEVIFSVYVNVFLAWLLTFDFRSSKLIDCDFYSCPAL